MKTEFNARYRSFEVPLIYDDERKQIGVLDYYLGEFVGIGIRSSKKSRTSQQAVRRIIREHIGELGEYVTRSQSPSEPWIIWDKGIEMLALNTRSVLANALVECVYEYGKRMRAQQNSSEAIAAPVTRDNKNYGSVLLRIVSRLMHFGKTVSNIGQRFSSGLQKASG